MKLNRKYLIIPAALMALVASCGTTGGIAGDSSATDADLKTFYVEKPKGRGWHVSVDREKQMVMFSSRTDLKADIQVFRNTVSRQDAPLLTADFIADDFRKGEESIMWFHSKATREYKLENVEKGEREINGRNFYYMTFRQVMNEDKLGFPANVDGIMYLRFLDSFPEPPIFYVLTFKDLYRTDTGKPGLKEDQIEQVLASFRPKS